ncbi:MAG: hypothetical protein MZV70_21175 [Desulfobacterales bacterium]|nr:hypothetical protein [Desulfobacterales bacterium]
MAEKLAAAEGGGVGRAGGLQQDAEDLAAARAAEPMGPAGKRGFDRARRAERARRGRTPLRVRRGLSADGLAFGMTNGFSVSGALPGT